jgi:hypothetical protein
MARNAKLNEFGLFTGRVVTRWLTTKGKPDRLMELIEDFAYTDPSGLVWCARAGRRVDGASIPSVFWGPLIGSPYVGDFRRASVVHDIACDDKPYTSDKAHLMFYHAMRCDGASEWLAKTLYTAVKLFGPQWGNRRSPKLLTDENIREFQRMVTSPDFATLPIEKLARSLNSKSTRRQPARRS